MKILHYLKGKHVVELLFVKECIISKMVDTKMYNLLFTIGSTWGSYQHHTMVMAFADD
ncbi:hypothetical protein KSP39_PZI018717 [Platanthera zijinensis]|uniref:Uncharacterized protein n=1 Tax=Platanthera zijinensis TaxID=2320716 RepID=A0AAP0B3A0_9ASPA